MVSCVPEEKELARDGQQGRTKDFHPPRRNRLRRAKRRRLSPEAREREIVDGAIRFFAEVGFGGGLRDLAKRLGITHQNLFRYFPTKEALIERVYLEVYFNRWQPEWETLLRDTSRPLAARLIDFYNAYLPVIFRYDWVRIFLFAGLKGVDIPQRYMGIIQARLVEPLALELRELAGTALRRAAFAPGTRDRLGPAWRAVLSGHPPLGVWPRGAGRPVAADRDERDPLPRRRAGGPPQTGRRAKLKRFPCAVQKP